MISTASMSIWGHPKRRTSCRSTTANATAAALSVNAR
ncbi:Uncharacterised protein [Mycobacterium tuberculosis]|nr:Uncharacterised protein [Mycobacterium tuberculosis]